MLSGRSKKGNVKVVKGDGTPLREVEKNRLERRFSTDVPDECHVHFSRVLISTVSSVGR